MTSNALEFTASYIMAHDNNCNFRIDRKEKGEKKEYLKYQSYDQDGDGSITFLEFMEGSAKAKSGQNKIEESDKDIALEMDKLMRGEKYLNHKLIIDNAPKTIPFLIQAAFCGPSEIAKQILSEIGERAIPHLVKAREIPIYKEKATFLIITLGNNGITGALNPLVEILNDRSSNWHLRSYAAEVLRAFGNKTPKEPLIKALDDPHESVRWQAAKSLCHIFGKNAIPIVSKLLNDPKSNVRISVSEDILTIYVKENDIEAIITATGHKCPELRSTAFYCLAPNKFCSGTKFSTDPRVNSLLIRGFSDPSPKVRRTVAMMVHDKSAIPALWNTLSDNVKSVRRQAAETLGIIFANNCINCLPSPAGKFGENRYGFINEELKKSFSHPDPKFRAAMAQQLRYADPWNETDTFNLLLTALNDKNANVRWIAALSIGDRYNGYETLEIVKKAIQHLKVKLQDKDYRVREAAGESIKILSQSLSDLLKRPTE